MSISNLFSPTQNYYDIQFLNGVVENDLTVNGKLIGLKLPTTGGTSSVLNYFSEQSVQTSFSGAFIAPIVAQVRYTRLNNIVFMTIPEIVAACANNTIILMSSIPSAFVPTTTNLVGVVVANAGATSIGTMLINTNGTAGIGLNPVIAQNGNPAFGLGATCGIHSQTICYSI